MSWAAIAVLDEAVAGPLTQDLEHLAASWIDTLRSKRVSVE